MARRTTPSNPAPDAAVWEPLYALADRVLALEPWEYLDETCLFGVQHPETGRIDYVLTMGGMGEHRAIAFYRGSDGLNGLMKMRIMAEAWEENEDMLGALTTQDCWMLSFEDRDEVSSTQRDRIKALGRTYRGRGAWPNFQDFAPYQFPWEISSADLPWLRTLLEQTLDVVERLRDDPTLLPETEPLGPHLARVHGADGVWRDGLLPVAPRSVPAPPPSLDPALIAELRAGRRVGNTLEIGSVPMPEPVMGEVGGAPYFVAVVMIVEPNSGLIVGNDLGPLVTIAQHAVDTLVDTLRTQGLLPARIAVDSPALFRALHPLADALEIPLTMPEELPGLEAATGSFTGFFGGGF